MLEVLCQYCGNKMEQQVFSGPRTFYYECPYCGSESPRSTDEKVADIEAVCRFPTPDDMTAHLLEFESLFDLDKFWLETRCPEEDFDQWLKPDAMQTTREEAETNFGVMFVSGMGRSTGLYLIQWRCWDYKPTPEQRRETPWLTHAQVKELEKERNRLRNSELPTI